MTDVYDMFQNVHKKYKKKARPTNLHDACIMAIAKWEELINIALKHKFVPKSKSLGCSSCSLCKFFNITESGIFVCRNCMLNCISPFSSYNSANWATDYISFVKHSYKLIRKIREGYEERTGEVLE